jgi:hypothetical protein
MMHSSDALRNADVRITLVPRVSRRAKKILFPMEASQCFFIGSMVGSESNNSLQRQAVCLHLGQGAYVFYFLDAH